VAVDRRAFARVETGLSDLQLESKDTLMRMAVPAASALPEGGVAGLVRRVLEGLGVESGLRIVAQARVPFGAGLASGGALAVAVAAAIARARDLELGPEALAGYARHADAFPEAEPLGLAGALVSVLGGVVGAPPLEGANARLRADPARVEECLLLVDPAAAPLRAQGRGEGRGGPKPSDPRSLLAQIADLAHQVRDAVERWRPAEVTRLLRLEHRLRQELLPGEAEGGVGRIVEIAESAGGAARLCGQGPHSLVLLWAEPGERGPGPRETAVRALKEAGYRLFPCRVDLRGLEVEDA
jgi:galactokinase/mevalonate kinase-like predicted kinase